MGCSVARFPPLKVEGGLTNTEKRSSIHRSLRSEMPIV